MGASRSEPDFICWILWPQIFWFALGVSGKKHFFLFVILRFLFSVLLSNQKESIGGNRNLFLQSEVSQKDKDHYSILTHIYGILKDGNDNPICKTEKETQMYKTDF